MGKKKNNYVQTLVALSSASVLTFSNGLPLIYATQTDLSSGSSPTFSVDSSENEESTIESDTNIVNQSGNTSLETSQITVSENQYPTKNVIFLNAFYADDEILSGKTAPNVKLQIVIMNKDIVSMPEIENDAEIFSTELAVQESETSQMESSVLQSEDENTDGYHTIITKGEETTTFETFAKEDGSFEIDMPNLNVGFKFSVFILNESGEEVTKADLEVLDPKTRDEFVDDLTEESSDTSQSESILGSESDIASSLESAISAATENSSEGSESSVNEEQASEEPVVSKSLRSFSAFSVVQEPEGNTYYYVQSGDSLNSIVNYVNGDQYEAATGIDINGLTVTKLLQWNPEITSANSIYVGQLISVDGTNVYEDYCSESLSFSTNQQFIDYIAAYAPAIAKQYGLYASVMIAQAALETGYGNSSLATLGNNFYGIKGAYNGKSIIMKTWEQNADGSTETILAQFKLYPSYKESIKEGMTNYAEKLVTVKNWLSSIPYVYYYAGAWVANTDSFRDATLYLSGKYATDTDYYKKLNSIINVYKLYQYDTKSYTPFYEYEASIVKSGYSLDSLPYGSKGSFKEGSSSDYIGVQGTVVYETMDGAYVNFVFYDSATKTTKDIFIDKRAIKSTGFDTETVNYKAVVGVGGYSIDSLPWGEEGFSNISNSNKYLGQEVTVISEAKNGAYLLIAQGGETIGWIDYRSIEHFTATDVSYNAVISSNGYSIDNLPWGQPGYKTVGKSATYVGLEVKVTRETMNGAYAYIMINEKGIGWIDERALNKFETKIVDYTLPILNTGYSIDSLPWGTAGFHKVGTSGTYTGKIVTVKRESANGAYAEIQIDNKIIGWIDKKAFGANSVSYDAGISIAGYSVDNLPWGVVGYKMIGKTADYVGSIVQVKAETTNGAYALVQLNETQLGWVDKRSLTKLNTKTVSYTAIIKFGGYSIDSLPWGTKGFKTIGKSSLFLNQQITVTKESSDGAYAYVTLNDEGIGWLDKRAFY